MALWLRSFPLLVRVMVGSRVTRDGIKVNDSIRVYWESMCWLIVAHRRLAYFAVRDDEDTRARGGSEWKKTRTSEVAICFSADGDSSKMR